MVPPDNFKQMSYQNAFVLEKTPNYDDFDMWVDAASRVYVLNFTENLQVVVKAFPNPQFGLIRQKSTWVVLPCII